MSIHEIGHYINGQRVRGERTKVQDVYNPATGDVTGSVALASTAEFSIPVAR